MKRGLALLLILLITIPVGYHIPPVESLGQKWNDSIAGSYVFDRCISCENTYHNNTSGQVNVTLTNIDPFSQTILINTIELSFIWINLETTVLRGTNFTRLDVDNSSTWTFDFNIPGKVKTEDDHQFQFRVFYRVLSRVALGAELDVRSPTDHIRITDIEQVTSDAALAKALVKLVEVNQTTYGSPVARDLVRDAQKAYDLGLFFFNNTRWHNATQHANIVLDLLDKIPAAEEKYTDEIIASMKSRLEGVKLDLYGSIEAKDFFARAQVTIEGAEAAFTASNYTGAQELVKTTSLFFASAIQVEADYLIELRQDAESSISKAEKAIEKLQSKDPQNEEARKLLDRAIRELQVARSFLSAHQSQAANANATNAIKLISSAEELEGGSDRQAQAKINLARVTLRPLWDRDLSDRAAALVDRSTEAFNNAEAAYLNNEFTRAIQLAEDSLSLSSAALQQGGGGSSSDQPLTQDLSSLTQDLSLIWLIGGIAALAAAGIGAFLVIRRLRAGYSLFSK